MNAAEYRRKMGLPPPGQAGGVVTTTAKPKIRLPKKREPNKTETEYIRILESKFPKPHFLVLYEPFTFRLPSGCRYTPDVVVVYGSMTDSASIRGIYEVKGPHIHNSASIRAFKEAKAAFPFWRFVFAQKTKQGWATA